MFKVVLLIFTILLLPLVSPQALAEPFDFVSLRIRGMNDHAAAHVLGVEFLAMAKQAAYERMARLYPEVAGLSPEEFSLAFSFHIDLSFLSAILTPPGSKESLPVFITSGQLVLYAQQRQLSRSEMTGELSNIDPSLVRVTSSRSLDVTSGFPEPSAGSDTSFLKGFLTPDSLMTFLTAHPEVHHYIPFVGANPVEVANYQVLRWSVQQTPANLDRRLQGLRSLVLALIQNMDFSWHIPASSIQSIVGGIVQVRRTLGSEISSVLRGSTHGANVGDLDLLQKIIERQLESIRIRKASYWDEIGVKAQIGITHLASEDVIETRRPIWGLGFLRRVERAYRVVTVQLDVQASVAGRPLAGLVPTREIKFMIMDGTATVCEDGSLLTLNSFFDRFYETIASTALSTTIERRDHQSTLVSTLKRCGALLELK